MNEGRTISGLKTQASQALIALEPGSHGTEMPFARPRPSAAFLAQLIGAEQNAPQTRQRRRAEPAEAAAAYLKAGRSV